MADNRRTGPPVPNPYRAKCLVTRYLGDCKPGELSQSIDTRRGIRILCFPKKFLAFNAGRQTVSSFFISSACPQGKRLLKGRRCMVRLLVGQAKSKEKRATASSPRNRWKPGS